MSARVPAKARTVPKLIRGCFQEVQNETCPGAWWVGEARKDPRVIEVRYEGAVKARPGAYVERP